MTIRSSLLFAQRLIFPRADKASIARKSLAGAFLCIGISIVPLVVVLTVSNGMIYGMTERIIGLSSSHIEAALSRTSEHTTSAQRLELFAQQFEQVSGVTSAFPEANLSALAASSSFRMGVQLRAVLPAMFTDNASFASLFKIVEGRYDDFVAGSRTAIVGQHAAERLGLHAGDSFRIIAAAQSINDSIVPRTASLKVAAIISSGYQELDAAWLFVPLDTGFNIIRAGAGRYFVRIETADAFSAQLMRVQSYCADVAGFDADVYRWDELNRARYENFSSTKVMLVFIMLLIVLVASVNISSSLVMLVMEKRREIAIIKSIGGSQHGIALSFLVTGTVCGIGGVLVGLPLGLLCATNVNFIIKIIEKIVNAASKFLYLLSGRNAADFASITLMDPAYYLTEVPVLIPLRDLAVIVVSTILLSLAVSVIPAYKAGREKPLETLRKV
ncbi:MAG: ABC transporter permease [Treponema sp.]|nr:ABC transporter permease [Treponema sp.]